MLFSTSQEVYEPLTNPISINEEEIWEPETVYPVYFNFEFEINGQIFTALTVDAGIGVTFPGFNSPHVWIWGSEWGGWPFLFDRGIDVSESPIGYEIVGESGHRIMKIQWQNAGIRDSEGDDPDDFVDFQFWVCEGTNRIEVHYGSSQVSDLSFGYNDGPGVRFFNIEEDWGICVSGFADLPSWDWVLFDGPVGGCLLNGVPAQDIVFNFFPNPTVAVNELNDSKKVGFYISADNNLNKIELHIESFKYGNEYELTIYNTIGVKVFKQIVDMETCFIDKQILKEGLYIFALNNSQHITTQKIIIQ